jgi:hypothetical protein
LFGIWALSFDILKLLLCVVASPFLFVILSEAKNLISGQGKLRVATLSAEFKAIVARPFKVVPLLHCTRLKPRSTSLHFATQIASGTAVPHNDMRGACLAMTREEDPRNDNSGESMILSPLYSVILSEVEESPCSQRQEECVIAMSQSPERSEGEAWQSIVLVIWALNFI